MSKLSLRQSEINLLCAHYCILVVILFFLFYFIFYFFALFFFLSFSVFAGEREVGKKELVLRKNLEIQNVKFHLARCN